MRETESLRRPVSEMLHGGKSIEEVLRFLRDSECSKIDSMWLLEDVAGMTELDAKKAVHFSAVWQDVRAHDEAIQDALLDEARKQGHVRPDGSIQM